MAQTPLGPWPSRSPLWSQGSLITDRDWSKWLSRLRDDLNAATTLLDSDVALKSAPNAFTAGNSFAGIIDLLSGQLHFPATQNPSANANTLDDYEEGTCTLTLTFDTPGDLAVTYAVRVGAYSKIGRDVIVDFNIATATFTWTTASGNLTVTGLPFTSLNLAASVSLAYLQFTGLTFPAGYTTAGCRNAPNTSAVTFIRNGSAVATTFIIATDTIPGTNLQVTGTLIYKAAA